MGNMGACVRVAAAADAAGVLTTGDNDPWHPDALRGAAGLHFALPVAVVEELPPERPPAGRDRPRRRDLGPGDPAARDPRLRHRAPRLQRALLERADPRIGFPMRAGVSSLNLATAVAAVLFAQRLFLKNIDQ